MPEDPKLKYLDEQGRTDAEVYLTNIYDGKIIACKTMRKLADMVLPWFHEEYHGFHYDVDRALRPVIFTERFCCFPEGPKRGLPFIMEQFQKAAFELAYGFINENGIRKHQQVVWEIARKNGKSSIVGALGLYHLMSDGEPGAEVYCCATGESQARKVYAAADQMRENSPALNKRLRRGMAQKNGRSAINYDQNGSMLAAIAANPRRKDGLSASAILYDELAAVEDNGALLDQLEESTSARRQPMTWIISSENYIRDGIWDERIGYCKGILNGTVHDDTVLPLLYTLDSRDEIRSEKNWVKANPGLYVIKDVEALRKRCNLAAQSPSRLPSVLTKEFCLRSGAYSSFLDINDCVNHQEIDFPINDVPYAVFGFDLAAKNDLCSCVMRFRRPHDDNIYEVTRFWLPSEKINMMTDGNQTDHLPYNLWASQGWVEVVEGDRINNYVIIDFLREMVDEGIYPFAVGFDPWNVDDSLSRDLSRLIGATRLYPVPQTARVISPLMKEHAMDLKAHRVICPNPCLHHNRASVQAREDNNANIFPKKKDLRPSEKIDGFMAELFALGTEKKFQEEYMSAIGWDDYQG